MTAPPPRRPWWKRKRTWGAVAVWLILPPLYFLSWGPAFYAYHRGWLPGSAFDAVWHEPLWAVLDRTPYRVQLLFDRYTDWWRDIEYEWRPAGEG